MALVAKQKGKPLVAHRKRVGQHHKQSKQYIKHYWPYLPMLLVVGLGVCINTLWSSHAVLGARSDFSAPTLLSATNADRATAHLSPLSLNAKLTDAAVRKAHDMSSRNYWSHTAPDGKTPWDFISGSGYQYQLAGENLAYGFADADSTETGWMNSTEHKANILADGYSDVGFATVNVSNYLGKGPATIVVAEYATPTTAVSNITFTVPNPPVVAGASSVRPREVAAGNVARVQLLTGGHATWSLVALSIVASSALTAFLIRHGLRVNRLLSRGEHFVAGHALLDVAILTVAVAGFVLTRTAGIIH